MCLTLTDLASLCTALSAGATAVYTFITYRTLKEIENQRETTYKPEIIVEGCHFYLYSTKGKKLDFPTEYSLVRKPKGYISDAKYSEFSFKIYNIGFASAKNIQFEFLPKSEEIVRLNHCLQFIESKNKVQIIQHNDSIEFKRFDDSSDLPKGNHSISGQNSRTLNHLLPVNIDNKPFNIYIPTYLLLMHSLKIFYSSNPIKNTDILRSPFTFILNIKYQDIGNKMHEKNFNIMINDFGSSQELAFGEFVVNEQFISS
ncbi:hypothetical protein [Flectobacillus roseus]|uniref:hypothetical protein n=1 Tax=Flectobacillus roseus TaxID=502259 RepID=UPI0024B81DE2|nr:hypothetical protein [Flectobacillus roseus]MDI9870594.1 hypothetical protein [Flectobacillus roseus]